MNWLKHLKAPEHRLTLFLVIAILVCLIALFRIQNLLDGKTAAITADWPGGTPNEQATEPAPVSPTRSQSDALKTSYLKPGPTLAPVQQSIDINTADQDVLQIIPGIGPGFASAIIRHRDEHGPFGSEWEVKKVAGIGEKRFERMRPYLEAFGPREGRAPAQNAVALKNQSTPSKALDCPHCKAPLTLSHSKYPRRPPYCPSCLQYLEATLFQD